MTILHFIQGMVIFLITSETFFKAFRLMEKGGGRMGFLQTGWFEKLFLRVCILLLIVFVIGFLVVGGFIALLFLDELLN